MSKVALKHGPHHDSEFHHHHSHAAASSHPGEHHLLSIENLSVGFEMYDPAAPYFLADKIVSSVVHDLNLSVHQGEVLALVGASGSGKTVLADAIMGFWQPNEIVSGTIWFDGDRLDADRIQSLRGNVLSTVPQSVSNLDPLMPIGRQVVGAARGASRSQRRSSFEARQSRMKSLFAKYGLGAEVERMYPHELSGGMLRRVLLLCALMDEPRLIIADEPTPGLDLDLAMRAVGDLRKFADSGGGVLLITHDIELALRCADRVAIFHDGTVVEETSTASFASPDLLVHPFSKALWHALPEHGFFDSPYIGTQRGDA
ncbi:ATP-binding cassette domain-containing protein [Collinsella tanakaei]|uniref:ATP-binding cassette domain-containing protein n=1 Tax=Collinsella tanakaei TaxID=626935 RepID=UPI002941F0EE|nr:ATP-binding cassette domain-containing protein [Collinsella tanakaei]